MKRNQKQKFENLDDERELWALLREAKFEQGIDFDGILDYAIESVKQKLPLPGARTDFVELELNGRSPLMIGLLLATSGSVLPGSKGWAATVDELVEGWIAPTKTNSTAKSHRNSGPEKMPNGERRNCKSLA